jgi:hypothetical protein
LLLAVGQLQGSARHETKRKGLIKIICLATTIHNTTAFDKIQKVTLHNITKYPTLNELFDQKHTHRLNK